MGPGAVTLHPTQTPWGAFLSGAFWAIVWNGVLAGVAYLMVKDTLGEFEGSLTVMAREVAPRLLRAPDAWLGLLCSSPLILIGLLMLLAIPFSLLTLFNPRPRLTLSAPSIPAGGQARLHWRLSSGGAGIRRLTIVLQRRRPYRTPLGPVVEKKPRASGAARGRVQISVRS
jgi:hypothetical protein